MLRSLPRARDVIVLFLLCVAALLGCQFVFGDPEIGDPPPDDGEPPGPATCMEGEFRCNREYLLSCGGEDTGWTLNSTCPTAERCDSRNKRCTVCEQGASRCNGAAREVCNADGTDWDVAEMCDSPDTCSPGACGPCTPGDFQCEGPDGNVLRECLENEQWADVATCATGAVCENTRQMALRDPAWSRTCEAGCDEPGVYRCQGAQLQQCLENQTRWDVIDDCATVELCELTAVDGNSGATALIGAVLDKCFEGCGTPGMHRCTGMTLEQCREDLTGWDAKETCAAGTECNPMLGACTDPCSPGEYQCNDKELRRCKEDLTWEVVQTCALASLCKPMANGCETPECPEAGVFKCDGANLFECSEELKWVPEATCRSAELCNATSKRCDPATCEQAGALSCFGQELKQCSVGLTLWIPPFGRTQPLVCPAGRFCDATSTDPGCKTECPAPRYCNGRNLVTCSPNEGERSVACLTDALCQCALSGTCAAGVGANGCGVPACNQDQARCSGGTVQRCLDGLNGWEDEAECGSASLCYELPNNQWTAYCLACPTAGETRCSGNSTLQTCSPTRTSWVNTACGAYPCMENGTADYCAVCNLGDVRCAGRNLQRCAANRSTWNSQDCGTVALCDMAAGQCDRCTANSVDCAGAVLTQCSADGQMQSMTTCDTPELCNEAMRRCDTPACLANQRTCMGAQPRICNAGRTGYTNDGAVCASAALCNAGPTGPRCFACTEGALRCVEEQPQICNATQTGWTNDGMACSSAALCRTATTGARCGQCIAGERRCVEGQPQICSASQTWTNEGMECASADLCRTTTPRCGQCVAGTRRCVEAQPQICNAMQTWVDDGMECASAALCRTTPPRCGECVAGTQRCVEDQPQVCSAMQTWVNDGMACAPPSTCTATGTTTRCATPVVCMPNERRCMGAQPQICNAAQSGWVDDGMECASAALCRTTTPRCGECTGTARRCMGAQPQVCTAQLWTDSGDACGSAALCNPTTATCYECVPNATSCIGTGMTTLRRCAADGSENTDTPCTGTTPVCNATAGRCDECAATAPPTCTAEGAVRTCGAMGQWVDTPCAAPNVCISGICGPPISAPVQ